MCWPQVLCLAVKGLCTQGFGGGAAGLTSIGRDKRLPGLSFVSHYLIVLTGHKLNFLKLSVLPMAVIRRSPHFCPDL